MATYVGDSTIAHQAEILCADCNAVFDRLDSRLCHRKDKKDKTYMNYEEPFKTFRELKVSADNGCKVCQYWIDTPKESLTADAILKLELSLSPKGREDIAELHLLYPHESPEACLDIRLQVNNGLTIPPLGARSDSDETFDQIKQWIEECNSQHYCTRWNSINGTSLVLPSRLLEIESLRNPTSIRLVSSEALPLDTRYLALSHCWGRSMPLRLTTDSITTFENGIFVSALPATSRDLVTVASRLSIQHLWIDSLCILQDSIDDWLKQAKEMATVYANSYVNIAASDSANSSGGLFRARDITTLRSFKVRLQNDRTYLCYNNTFLSDVGNSMLSQRAWVVQERFLSPRVIHFCKQQVHWECICHATSENIHTQLSCLHGFYSDMKTLDFAHQMLQLKADEASQSAWLDTWDRLLMHYTSAELTISSDKAIAAHALAVTVCKHLGYNFETAYVNGLWRAQFVQGLLWQSRDSRETYRMANGACSWSWISMHGAILSRHRKWGSRDPLTRDPRTTVTELLDVQADCTLGFPTTAAGGFARVHGPLCMVTFKVNPLGEDSHEHLIAKSRYSLQVGNTLLEDRKTVVLYLDSDEYTSEPDGIARQACLLLCRVRLRSVNSRAKCEDPENPHYEAGEYDCLLLEPVHAQPGCFRRFGYADFEGPYLDGLTTEEKRAHNLPTWKILDTHFRSYDVPEGLYCSVDDDFKYTIVLV